MKKLKWILVLLAIPFCVSSLFGQDKLNLDSLDVKSTAYVIVRYKPAGGLGVAGLAHIQLYYDGGSYDINLTKAQSGQPWEGLEVEILSKLKKKGYEIVMTRTEAFLVVADICKRVK